VKLTPCIQDPFFFLCEKLALLEKKKCEVFNHEFNDFFKNITEFLKVKNVFRNH
jgi:hypothetical protein